MALANYSDLVTQISVELRDSSIESYYPNWITLLEQDLKRRLRVREMGTRATATTTAGSQYLELPTGYQEMRSLHIVGDPVRHIEIVDIDFLNEIYEVSSNKPDYAAFFGTEMKFNCPADSAYTIEMIYHKFPTGLSVTNTTNTIMTNYPHIYLWGVCMLAQRFLKDPEREAHFQELYEMNLSQANMDAEDARYGGKLRQRIIGNTP